MSYTSYDFTETLGGCGIDREDVKRVIWAWGIGGDYAEWEGGFLLEMKNGTFAYIDGWCDTTGWGCQDGTNRKDFDKEPTFAECVGERPKWGQKITEKDVDHAPADLQRFVETGEGKWT